MIPCGLIQGIKNVDANQLNILSEFIGGYMFTGKPLANMCFKILSTDVVGHGIYFVMDVKLGHYMKVPPRTPLPPFVFRPGIRHDSQRVDSSQSHVVDAR